MSVSAFFLCLARAGITKLSDQRQQPATVTESTYLGNIMEYHVVLGDGAVLRVQTHPGQQFAIGDKVAVRIDSSRCSLFEVPAAGTQEAQGADA